MDLLKKELERKRKTIELAKQSNISCNGTSKGKRAYLKAGELRRIQEEQEEERKIIHKRHNRMGNHERKRRRKDEDASVANMNKMKHELSSRDMDGKNADKSSQPADPTLSTKSSLAASDKKNDIESHTPNEGSEDKNQNPALKKMSSSEITNALRENTANEYPDTGARIEQGRPARRPVITSNMSKIYAHYAVNCKYMPAPP